MKALQTLSALALAALATACTTGPQTRPTAGSGECAQIRTRLAAAEQAHREAQQQKQDAWKAIVPFAAVARRLQADQALDAAEHQQAALQAAARNQGCSHGA